MNSTQSRFQNLRNYLTRFTKIEYISDCRGGPEGGWFAEVRKGRFPIGNTERIAALQELFPPTPFTTSRYCRSTVLGRIDVVEAIERAGNVSKPFPNKVPTTLRELLDAYPQIAAFRKGVDSWLPLMSAGYTWCSLLTRVDQELAALVAKYARYPSKTGTVSRSVVERWLAIASGERVTTSSKPSGPDVEKAPVPVPTYKGAYKELVEFIDTWKPDEFLIDSRWGCWVARKAQKTQGENWTHSKTLPTVLINQIKGIASVHPRRRYTASHVKRWLKTRGWVCSLVEELELRKAYRRVKYIERRSSPTLDNQTRWNVVGTAFLFGPRRSRILDHALGHPPVWSTRTIEWTLDHLKNYCPWTKEMLQPLPTAGAKLTAEDVKQTVGRVVKPTFQKAHFQVSEATKKAVNDAKRSKGRAEMLDNTVAALGAANALAINAEILSALAGAFAAPDPKNCTASQVLASDRERQKLEEVYREQSGKLASLLAKSLATQLAPTIFLSADKIPNWLTPASIMCPVAIPAIQKLTPEQEAAVNKAWAQAESPKAAVEIKKPLSDGVESLMDYIGQAMMGYTLEECRIAQKMCWVDTLEQFEKLEKDPANAAFVAKYSADVGVWRAMYKEKQAKEAAKMTFVPSNVVVSAGAAEVTGKIEAFSFPPKPQPVAFEPLPPEAYQPGAKWKATDGGIYVLTEWRSPSLLSRQWGAISIDTGAVHSGEWSPNAGSATSGLEYVPSTSGKRPGPVNLTASEAHALEAITAKVNKSYGY